MLYGMTLGESFGRAVCFVSSPVFQYSIPHGASSNISHSTFPTTLLLLLFKLFAENNRLTSIPASTFANNPELTRITMENNLLTHDGLPEGLFIHNTQLNELHLSNNKLQSWPASLAELREKIEILDLASNTLGRIPSFANQPNLKYLDVSSNNITSLDTLVKDCPPGMLTADGNCEIQNGWYQRLSLILIGRNPVCANGTVETRPQSDMGVRWVVLCRSQCSSTCPSRIPPNWQSRGGEVSTYVDVPQSNDLCSPGCNTSACSYDGGDCA